MLAHPQWLSAAATILVSAVLLGRRRRLRTPSFMTRARMRGLDREMALTLWRHARQITPERPDHVLYSRELFELAALRAVWEPGSGEISFESVEAHSRALERLGLARSSDFPDPFRRVLLHLGDGAKQLAIAVSHVDGKLVLIAPPGTAIAECRGDIIRVIYGGKRRMVEYPLEVSCVSHGPNGTVVFLERPQGQGQFGRIEHRMPVLLRASIMAIPKHRGDEDRCNAEVFDISMGGLRIVCSRAFETGENVYMTVALEDGHPEPLMAEGRVAWSSIVETKRWNHGIRFVDLREGDARRLRVFLSAVGERSVEEASEPIVQALVV